MSRTTPPRAGKAHIYLFDEMDSLNAGFAADNLQRLPAFRRKHCEKYRQGADKNACILAYLLLEKGLREQFGVTAPPTFIYNERGKPYLSDTPHIYFNLSHCKRGVVCALADFEIGVDIQDVRPYNTAMIRWVCSDKEMRQLEQYGNATQGFFELWVKKESYAKAKGIGIASVLKRDLPESGFVVWECDDYFVSLFHEAPPADAAVEIITCRLPI